MKWQIAKNYRKNYKKKRITAKYCETLIIFTNYCEIWEKYKIIKKYSEKHIAVLLESCAYGERVEAIWNMTNLRKQ